MRLAFIFFAVSIVILGCQTSKYKFNPDFRVLDDSTKMEILKKVDYSKYIGKSVGDILKNDTIKYFIDYMLIEGKPYTLSSLLLSYSEDVTLQIHVSQVKYQPDVRYDGKWDYGLFQKEKISRIVLKFKSNPILSVKNPQ